MIAQLFAIIAPVLVAAGIGFYWARSKRSFDTAFVGQVVSNIGTPCLVFSTLARTEADPALIFTMAGGTLAATAGFLTVAYLGLRIARQPIQPYLSPLTFANTGNMGLPLALFAFGKEGLAMGIAHFTVTSILNFTVGQLAVAGRAQLGAVLRSPILPAALAGAVVVGFQLHVPDWIANTTQLLGGLTIPLMLLMLGVSLANLKISGLKRALGLSVFRLALGFSVGVATAWALALPTLAGKVLVLQASMPVAVYSYVFALRYNQRPDDIASMVVISTTLSFITVPLVLLYLL